MKTMKPFLGINAAENEQDSSINGEEFLVVRAASGDDTAEADKKEKKPAEKYVSPLPTALRVIKFICGMITIMMAVFYVIQNTFLNLDFVSPMTIIASAIGFLAIWLALTSHESALENKRNAEKNAELSEDEEPEDDESADLELPENAEDVDLLAFNYVYENGEPKAIMANDESASEYFNCSMKLFADEEKIYLASIDEKYAFERASLIGIRSVSERIAIPDWNKDTPPTKGEFKQFELTVDNLNRIIVPGYHILELDCNGEKWGIYFPCYELPTFESITGLSAE